MWNGGCGDGGGRQKIEKHGKRFHFGEEIGGQTRISEFFGGWIGAERL